MTKACAVLRESEFEFENMICDSLILASAPRVTWLQNVNKVLVRLLKAEVQSEILSRVPD